ncbi:hypothetical protein EDB69_0674 [Vibrio crassostreae]|uniref:Uncharacterized protein n=1 Tax=Vibrio crassostreae TaxID=246167 RepID=A0ABP1WPB2_9VIBR|nr:hypothetical protein EDB64_1022 [Vibrio crassostreae]ROP14047.1 hypothetical protein EDB63_1055 [Vibrio crassostreae]ROQ88132.1 hypothetical protein EDB72_1689 [Vibrio crassostreae]ROS70946.1 hypothetical protein EDB73_101625 [Vibrio crassostreae]RPE94719.1 hypothetical protein EDB68_0751 [Vibrio crassostreae]
MLKLETDRLILRDMSLEDECTFVAMSQVQSVIIVRWLCLCRFMF